MIEVQLIHGDCLEILPTLKAGSVDAVVTDPPWMDYETGWYDASGHHNPVGFVHPDLYASELFRVLRDASACVLWCRWDCFELHRASMVEADFEVRNCIVWGKAYHTMGDLDGNLGGQHETAIFATKGGWKRHGKRETNLWVNIPQPFSKAKRVHPTEKPLALMKRAVELACPRDGLVLDPFAGSAATLVACMKTGRRGIGIELDARYIEPARDRLKAAETPLFAKEATP